jgi:succinate dehydrogenase/fumarate reductase-like Fe-S protein
MKTARLVIRRGAGFEEFELPFEDGATVLDGLIWLRSHRDPSLAIRYSCINANVCKECTIAIDGRVAYACTTALHDRAAIVLEPLPGKTVLRDLVSDTRPPRERLGDDPQTC